MSFAHLLGRRATLSVRRVADPGVFLASDTADTRPNAPALLLPWSELDHEVGVGDELDVFVYLDSQSRPVATTRAPRIELGQVAFLEVTDVGRFGAFVDWGLPKELLVPFAEQTRELARGDVEPVGLILDRSGRLAGTLRVRELLRTDGRFEPGEWVDGEAWRSEPDVGVFVIVERQFLALLPADEPHDLHRGQAMSFRVTHVHRDGKIELSLRGRGHEELASDAERVLEILSARGALPISEQLGAESIRARFGLSKKAFKRAVGKLLREGDVRLDAEGFIVPRPRR